MEQIMKREMPAYEDPDGRQKLYARAIYLLRESRKTLLKRYEVESEAELLEKIKSGQVDEHPAYDHYLGMLIMEQTREYVREDVLAQLRGSKADAPESVHLMLQEMIETHYAQRLSEPVRQAQDAMLLSFDSGLLMEVRYYNRDEYMISWSWGDADLRIDTAPIHSECPVFPQHLHGDDGTLVADSVTLPGTDCWTNFSRLLDILLVNPLLLPETPAKAGGGT